MLSLLQRSLRPWALRSLSTASTSTSVQLKSDKKAAPASAPQAPNHAVTWSTSQRPRPTTGEDPRFEQTAMELQPNPLSAMELVAREPIRLVQGRRAVCDGGGGPLGHPKIYINLDQPGPHPCGYVSFLIAVEPASKRSAPHPSWKNSDTVGFVLNKLHITTD
ncbi:hypothetical protein AX17_000218 [Amanita inopinata Kibby_2008]|nr:hypothetical protein AX17_000218 [Amanita inopinata Kibby_2008]